MFFLSKKSNFEIRDCVFTVLFGLFFVLSAFAENSDIRFLDGLSERGLFESAEFFYADRIQRVPESEKLPLATEFIRTLTQWTLQAESPRRPEILRKREQIEQEFLGPVDDGSNPLRTFSRIELRFQSVIGDFALGDVQRLEAVVATESERPHAVEEARKRLFDAIEKFKTCFDAVSELRRRITDAELERRTLSLFWNVRFQWGLAQKSVALTFSGEDDNRAFCLAKAVEILSETAALQIDDDAVFQSRVETASCYRLLGDLPKTAQMLGSLQGKPLSLEMQFRASTESLCCRLALGELDIALKEFGSDRAGSEIVPEYDLARLELFLAENRRQPSDETLGKIIRLVRNIEHRSGPYWGRRARLVLISSEFSIDNAELLKLLAEEQYHSGRFAESVRLYDRASEAATKSGNTEAAFQNARMMVVVWDKVAQLLRNTPDDQPAVRRQLADGLRNVAIRFADHPDSAELHLKAVDETAALVLEKSLPLERYVELLTEHVDHWPTSEKVPPLLLQAALIFERQKRPVDALALLERIPNDAPNASEAVAVAVRCFGQQKDARDSDVADWFERRLPTGRPWSNADVRAALESAGCRLRTQNADAAKAAERVLRQLEKRNDLPPSDKAKVLSGLVTSLTLQHRQAEASQILDQLDDDNLPPAEQRNLRLTKARVLAETGDVQDSINLLAGVLKEHPKDLAFRETLAEILTKQDEPEALNRALGQWKEIEGQSPQESEAWWNAKENRLRVLFKLGRRNEARKEYGVLELLYPKLGGAARKARFEAMFLDQSPPLG